MGIVLAFAVGYAVGANAGQEGYQEVIDAVRAVGRSEELQALVAALRSHAGATLRQLSVIVEGEPDEPLNPGRLLDRVRDLMGRAATTWPAS
jgi:hypothetical protein